MSGTVADKKRLIRVTRGNLDNDSFDVRAHYDFLPPHCYGPSKKPGPGYHWPLEISLEGLGMTVKTDIPTHPRTGKPRGIIRERGWIRRFYAHHQTRDGDILALERLGAGRYRLSPSDANEVRGGPTSFPKNGRGSRQFTAAEFFAGIGLVRLALEREGWRVLFANDICPEKAEMYRHSWPNDDHLLVGDIHKIKADQVPTCDLFTASFPCNDLSIAGAWAGLNGKDSSAFWGLIRILKDMGERRPPLVLLENVLGFLQSNRGKDFETALLALNELGYAVDAFILNAVHWAPQSRVRLFVIAKTANEGGSPNPFATESDTRPDHLSIFINTHPNVCWDIRDLPALPKPRLTLNDIVEDLPDDDPHWWDKRRSEYFFNQLSERHLKAARMMIGQKTYQYATAFRRARYGKSMAELRSEQRELLAPPHLRQRAAQNSLRSLLFSRGESRPPVGIGAVVRLPPPTTTSNVSTRLARELIRSPLAWEISIARTPPTWRSDPPRLPSPSRWARAAQHPPSTRAMHYCPCFDCISHRPGRGSRSLRCIRLDGAAALTGEGDPIR